MRLAKVLVPSFVLAALSVAPAALAQQFQGQDQDRAPTTQELRMQALMDKQRQLGMQMFQRLQQQGTDPREFFQSIGQGMADGSMDVGDIEKMMLDKGLIDKSQIEEMQQLASQTLYDNIRDALGASEDEWTVLKPKIDRVLTANASLGGNAARARGGMGGMASMMGTRGLTSEASMAYRAFRDAVKRQGTSDEEIATKLKLFREAHARALMQLEAAQKDLTDVLTVSQEATLVNMGILQ